MLYLSFKKHLSVTSVWLLVKKQYLSLGESLASQAFVKCDRRADSKVGGSIQGEVNFTVRLYSCDQKHLLQQSALIFSVFFLLLFVFVFVWKHQLTAMSKTSEQLLVLENFIGGKFVPCRSHIGSYDPSTGEVYCKVPDSGEEEVGHPVLLNFFIVMHDPFGVFSAEFLLRMKAGAWNCFFCCDRSAATHP